MGDINEVSSHLTTIPLLGDRIAVRFTDTSKPKDKPWEYATVISREEADRDGKGMINFNTAIEGTIVLAYRCDDNWIGAVAVKMGDTFTNNVRKVTNGKKS